MKEGNVCRAFSIPPVDPFTGKALAWIISSDSLNNLSRSVLNTLSEATSLCPYPTVTVQSLSFSLSRRHLAPSVPCTPGDASGMLHTPGFPPAYLGPLSFPLSPS